MGEWGRHKEARVVLSGLTPGKSGYRVRRERRWSTAGVTRPGTGSLHPVAIRAAVEATRLLKPLVQRVARRLGEHPGRNVSGRCASPQNDKFGLPTNPGGAAPALPASRPPQRFLPLRPACPPKCLSTLV